MGITEEQEVLTFFSDEESEVIHAFLAETGREVDETAPCGRCCGAYTAESWLYPALNEEERHRLIARLASVDGKGRVGLRVVFADADVLTTNLA